MAGAVVVRRARFQHGFSNDSMLRIGQAVADSVRDRIALAMTVYDTPAPPLKTSWRRGKKIPISLYAMRKQKMGLKPLRDWTFTGLTLRSLQILRILGRKITIGFNNPDANLRAVYNQRRSRQFGVSDKDRSILMHGVEQEWRRRDA